MPVKAHAKTATSLMGRERHPLKLVMVLAERGNEYFAAMEFGHVFGSGLQGLWGQVPMGMRRIR